jgi:aspartate dehydrogenase
MRETRVDRRVALLGYGAIGRAVCELAAARKAGPVTIVGVLVRDPGAYAGPAQRYGIPFVSDAAALLELRPDLVVEAAGHDGFRQHVPAILEAGVEVLSLSVGALADPATMTRIEAAAAAGGSRLRVPSGAIAALDAISAAAVGGIERVVHTVRKPPATLVEGPRAAEIVAGGQPVELFAGTAREAALLFPANVNVIAAVSLAGIGLDRTEARILADPAVTRNVHEVAVDGEFGRLLVRIENEPSENPKTGRIVAMSVVRSLRALGESIVVGA